MKVLADKYFGFHEEVGGEEELGEGEVEDTQTDYKMQLTEKVKYQIVGTVKNPLSYKQTEDIYQIVNDENFEEEILKCGIIIYDISYSDPDEIKKALGTLQSNEKKHYFFKK